MYYYRTNNFEYNECAGQGICSVSPKISSFHEVILILLRNITYYINEIEKFSQECTDTKIYVAKFLSNLITSSDYSDEQLLSNITCLYQEMLGIKHKYFLLCKEIGAKYKELKPVLKFNPDMKLSDILTIGQKISANKYDKFTNEQKNLYELLYISIRSLATSLMKLYDYDITDSEALSLLCKSVNIFNERSYKEKKIKNTIRLLAKEDLRVWTLAKDAQIKRFGQINPREVSYSTTPGKAILVSGSSLIDLANLLEAVKDKQIDVYSHGDLLIAHAFEYFKQFKNFKGHYGSTSDNNIIDFATFPGAILLTRHSTQNVEYLIRGRLFTTCEIAPKTVIKVINNNFDELIKTAENAKGFKKGQKRYTEIVGLNINDIVLKFKEISEKLKSGVIKHLIILGLANYSIEQSVYFDELFNKIPDDYFVITFSYHNFRKNVFYINIANNHPILLKLLEILYSEIPITSDNLTYFLAKCDVATLSTLISLRENGAKNIYLSSCPPTVVNPAIVKYLTDTYGINATSTAEKDLEKIANNK